MTLCLQKSPRRDSDTRSRGPCPSLHTTSIFLFFQENFQSQFLKMEFKSNEEVHPITILAGVAVFFVWVQNLFNPLEPSLMISTVEHVYRVLFASVVLYRRMMCGMSWGDAVSFNTHEKRVVRVNREYRRNDVKATTKRTTVVRFTIDGQVLSTDDG